MIKFIITLSCIFVAGLIYYIYKISSKPKTPSLHRKWTLMDELKDTYKAWLPLLVLIVVMTCIVIAMAMVSATEANIYYNGGLI